MNRKDGARSAHISHESDLIVFTRMGEKPRDVFDESIHDVRTWLQPWHKIPVTVARGLIAVHNINVYDGVTPTD